MKRIKLKIVNKEGLALSAYLKLPADGKAEALGIFAHCFTCGKNLNAIRNIIHSLTAAKVGVLSFDFTGLGESDGDFSDTNFSSNVSDLVDVATFLTKHYQVPQLLIGHSLGGAAVIQAASELPDIKAVITIGAPADASHVIHLFKNDIQEIQRTGQATVDIGGRPITIKKQFLDDLKNNPAAKTVNRLNKALLIMHSPQDAIVDIKNAASIYSSAKHPKSFVSLDGADHLLTDKEDSLYAGKIIATWASRYLDTAEESIIESESRVVCRTGAQGYTTDILAGKHYLTADEPVSIGGNDLGPTPYDLLLSSLGACTTITLRMYADRKMWPLKEIKVHLEHQKRHAVDGMDFEKPTSKLDHIDKVIELHGDLNQAQQERLLEISSRCPVHRTLNSKIVVNSKLAEQNG